MTKVGAFGLTTLFVSGAIAANFLLSRDAARLSNSSKIVIAVAIFGMCVIAWLMAYRQAIVAAYTAVVVCLACSVGARAWIIPDVVQQHDAAWMNQEIHEVIAGTPSFVVYKMSYHPFYYATEFPLIRVETDSALREQLERNRQLDVLAYLRDVENPGKNGPCRILKKMRPVDHSTDEMCLLELRLP